MIAWANDTRKQINDLFAASFHGAPLPEYIPDGTASEKAPQYTFREGMPLICIATEKASKRHDATGFIRPADYANNMWARLVKFEMETVLVQMETGVDLPFPLDEFFQNFVPGFAITVYAAQGCTMDWKFAIADIPAMRGAREGWRLYYTAISRDRKSVV